ncbi:MAG: helix-hairpin-helix domain-containing protein [Okeania sp. SIO2H7]|nr:helix-hairpin-helix domain-containing protein [Okeania sp. SIO2H7]
MSNPESWFQQTPKWIWWSFVPAFGGLAIAYAGQKTRTNPWIALGLGITVAAFILSQTEIAAIIWLGQIGTAFALKKSFLIKTYPQTLALPEEAEIAKLIVAKRGKKDFNTCSKDDLVNGLGLPIVYANDIESARNEGYIFTHLEELSEVIGIPQQTINKIAGQVIFTYDIKQESDVSWRRLNTYSVEQLIAANIEPEAANKIVLERLERGEYKSVMDVKKRTKLPLNSYRHII